MENILLRPFTCYKSSLHLVFPVNSTSHSVSNVKMKNTNPKLLSFSRETKILFYPLDYLLQGVKQDLGSPCFIYCKQQNRNTGHCKFNELLFCHLILCLYTRQTVFIEMAFTLLTLYDMGKKK